jgi:hypothetical protein
MGTLITLFGTACRPRETPVEAARATQTLLLGNGAEPGDLDPQLATAFTEFNIIIALGEGLTSIDEITGEPAPAAASAGGRVLFAQAVPLPAAEPASAAPPLAAPAGGAACCGCCSTASSSSNCPARQ